MSRYGLLFALVVGLASAGVAAAATLGVTSQTVQSGTDGDLVCDESGVTVAWILDGNGQVTGATVSNIDMPGCASNFLKFDTDAVEGCPCFVAALATTTVNFSLGPVSPTAINSVSILMVGPANDYCETLGGELPPSTHPQAA